MWQQKAKIRDTIVRRDPTHISQVKGPVGPEDNGKDGEDNLQDSKLEGAKFEQEERAPGVGTEEAILQ